MGAPPVCSPSAVCNVVQVGQSYGDSKYCVSFTDDQDYRGGEFNVSFQPGSRTSQVTIGILSDKLAEGDENFSGVLSTSAATTDSGLDVTIGDDTAMVTIVDDDVISCGFSPAEYVSNEGTNAILKVVCSGPASFDYVLNVTTRDQSATGESLDAPGWSGRGRDGVGVAESWSGLG